MSWDCYLVDKNGKTVIFNEPLDIKGGTYQLGGTQEAWFNITYNYGKILKNVLGYSLSDLNGKLVKDTISDIEKAVSKLSEEDKTENYWDATEYNTKRALEDLLLLAKKSENSYWMIC